MDGVIAHGAFAGSGRISPDGGAAAIRCWSGVVPKRFEGLPGEGGGPDEPAGLPLGEPVAGDAEGTAPAEIDRRTQQPPRVVRGDTNEAVLLRRIINGA
ncbi:hypothetical protein JCM17961_46460 [Endothiovibrio diazotrophicus]